MSTPEFEQQVSAALGAIPHRRNCAAREHTVRVADAPRGHNTYQSGGLWCDCDREQRIAQRVAAAILAATRSEQDTLEEARDLGLRALRGGAALGEREEP